MNNQGEKRQLNKDALEKVAILLLYLESIKPTVTHAFFKAIGETHSRVILNTMAQLGQVPQQTVTTTLRDFLEFLVRHHSIVGGINLTSGIFHDVYGMDLVNTVEKRIVTFPCLYSVDDYQPFSFISKSSVRPL